MTALAGVLDLSGDGGDHVEAMLSAMPHRGPVHGVLEEGPVTLGFRGAARTPEDADVEQPLQGGEELLVADLRVDNRRELASRLPVDPEASDPAFLHAAIREWGVGWTEHVVGVYAVAWWDGERLHLLRDALGVRPLYVAEGDGFVAFATEPHALLALPGVDAGVHGAAVVDLLARTLQDREATVHAGVTRLPPATHRVLDAEGRSRDRVTWDPWTIPQDPGMTRETATLRLRELLRDAVSSRLRTTGEVGVEVSGGLDSSTVACLARELREEALPAFTMTFPEVEESDERAYAEAVLDTGGFTPHWVVGDAVGPWTGMEAMHDAAAGPWWWPNLFLTWAVNEEAQDAGVDVLLTGLDGDIAVNHGELRLVELARRARWLRLARELRAMARLHDASVTGLLRRGVVHPLLGRGDEREHLELLRPEVREAARARLNLLEREEPRSDAAEHRQVLTSGLVPHMLEVNDLAAARQGVERRHPFFDRRVVEHCLRIPSKHRLHDGYTRHVLREATRGVLPETVRLRPGKANLGPNFEDGLLHRQWATTRRLLQEQREELEAFVRNGALDDVNRLREEEEPLTIWSLGQLALHLQQRGGDHT